MIRSRVNQLAEHFEKMLRPTAKPKHGFNMSFFNPTVIWGAHTDKSGHDCKTAMCIAGHTIAFFDGAAGLKKIFANRDHYPEECPFSKRARTLLGLTKEEAKLLFQPADIKCNPRVFYSHDEITLEDTIATLRIAAATGKVAWYVVAKKEPKNETIASV